MTAGLFDEQRGGTGLAWSCAGRRAWLFAGSERGAERAAIMYTFNRNRKTLRCRPTGLARRRARAHRRSAAEPAGRVVAVELAVHQAPYKSSLNVAAPSHVFTIGRVAELLAEEEAVAARNRLRVGA